MVGIPTLSGSLAFGLSQTQALVILFFVLPIVLAAIVVPLVGWRASRGPRPVLTSELLAEGAAAEGRIVSVKSLGNILDFRPMLQFDVEVAGEGGESAFPLRIVQSFPRSMVGVFRPGDIVRLRLSPDRSAGAIEWGYET